MDIFQSMVAMWMMSPTDSKYATELSETFSVFDKCDSDKWPNQKCETPDFCTKFTNFPIGARCVLVRIQRESDSRMRSSISFYTAKNRHCSDYDTQQVATLPISSRQERSTVSNRCIGFIACSPLVLHARKGSRQITVVGNRQTSASRCHCHYISLVCT